MQESRFLCSSPALKDGHEFMSLCSTDGLLISGKVAWQIIANARYVAGSRYRKLPLWVLVRDLTGHGSTNSYKICRSAGLDPNQPLGKCF